MPDIARGSDRVPAPYKGLKPFTEDDSALFFGRADETGRLVYSLRSSRLTVLYGARQVGKTSLLRAGIVDQLRQKSEKSGRADHPDSAVVVFDDWSGSNTVQRLSSAIDRELERLRVARQHGMDKRTTFVQRCECWSRCLGNGDKNGELFVLLDSFDDYLLRNPIADAGANGFDSAFADAVSMRGLQVNFLIAIGDDFLASLDRYRYTIPSLYGNLVRLDALTRSQAIEAIQKPVYEVYNEQHKDEKIGMEADLVRAVLGSASFGSANGAGKASSARAVGVERFDPGRLQLAMEAVWERDFHNKLRTLHHKTFETLEGIHGIATRYVEKGFRRLSPLEKNLSCVIFDHLIAPGGPGGSRRTF
jgi:hypothetical protein